MLQDLKEIWTNPVLRILVILWISIMILFVITKCTNDKISKSRNLEYEHYCDSIWINNPDYYLDVLVESDEYQQYIQANGQWWNN